MFIAFTVVFLMRLKFATNYNISVTPYSGAVERATWSVSLVDQGLLTVPKHLTSPSIYVGFVLLNL